MRKIILAVAIVIMSGNAQAQKIPWGVRVGLNIPSIHGGGISSDSSVGFHVGAVLDCGLTESFYIQPGLYFTTKGAKDMNLSYLQIPILASYWFNLEGDTKLHINAGLYFASSVSKAFRVLGYNGFDTGLVFGAGVGFSKKYYAGLNYDLGLADLIDGVSMKNRSFNISIGYNFL